MGVALLRLMEWDAARFSVLFDGTTKKVRSTLSLTEAQVFRLAQQPQLWPDLHQCRAGRSNTKISSTEISRQ